MKIAMIVAMAENGVIGNNNELPWHLPKDLPYFKQVTMAKPIIMGRKTFESIGRPLSGRPNIVISRNSRLTLPKGVHLVAGLEHAIALAATLADNDEMMIIGGAEIYRQAVNKADMLYLTKVHADVKGDAYFDCFNETDWQLVNCDRHEACEKNSYAYSFCVYQRA